MNVSGKVCQNIHCRVELSSLQCEYCPVLLRTLKCVLTVLLVFIAGQESSVSLGTVETVISGTTLIFKEEENKIK